MKRIYHLGCHYTGEVFIKVAFDKGRLSFSGVIGPKKNGNATGACGQIQDEINPSELRPLAPGWTVEKVARFLELWKRWHLNDMRPGCEHQRAMGWDELPINPAVPLSTYGKHFPEQITPSWNMLTWVTRKEHPKGLLCEPCPVCGHKYGSAWLMEKVPLEVLHELSAFPETDITPAWV